jgi:hypothetical protein
MPLVQAYCVDTTGSVVNIASEAEFGNYIDSPYGGFGRWSSKFGYKLTS